MILIRYWFDEKLVTIWSAPNYCYRCGNVAAIIELDGSMNNTQKIFDAALEEEFERRENKSNFLPDYFL